MKKIFTLLTASLIITANTVLAQEQSENIFTHKVGKFEVILLSEGQGQGKIDILIRTTPQMQILATDSADIMIKTDTSFYTKQGHFIEQTVYREFKPRSTPPGTFPNAYNAFLIKTPEHNILVDAGRNSAKLSSNLRSVGVSPEQIDAVLITHMHGDHIGGLLENDKAAFPKAKIYISQPEYDFWTDDKAMQQMPEEKRGGFINARKVIAAYKDKVILFQPNTLGKNLSALLPGVSGIAAYGHTPGHTMYLVKSNKDKMLIWGDLTHAMAIQMSCPSVAVTYDVDAKQAVIARKKVLDYVLRKNVPVAGMHIPFPAMGTISTSTLTSGGYIFHPYNE
jgi:glyoxylase-like metal-dependent hydrolase (beta-lactamase superfamily II)